MTTLISPVANNTASASAPEFLFDFIEKRKRYDIVQADQLWDPISYIGQWETPGERVTCTISSILNGLLGIRAITTSEATRAHDEIAGSEMLRWEFDNDSGFYVPQRSRDSMQNAFNNPGVLPVGVEFSGIYCPTEIPREELVRCIGEATLANIAILIRRNGKPPHTTVMAPSKLEGRPESINSIFPDIHQTRSPREVATFLLGDATSEFQLLHERPLG